MHQIVTHDPYSQTPLANVVVDSIHYEPLFKDKYGKVVPKQFNTALVNYWNSSDCGVKGMFLLNGLQGPAVDHSFACRLHFRTSLFCVYNPWQCLHMLNGLLYLAVGSYCKHTECTKYVIGGR